MVSLYTYILQIILVGCLQRVLRFTLICAAECSAIYSHTHTCFIINTRCCLLSARNFVCVYDGELLRLW
jgi:hypothetical protein